MKSRWLVLVLLLIAAGLAPWRLPPWSPPPCEPDALRVGSKAFTESVVLAEIAVQLGRHGGAEVVHRPELGGTRVLFELLVAGEIDAYPEYTGTIREEILAGEAIESDAGVHDALLRRGVLMARPLGFNNGYAIGMKEERARQLDIRTVSDLKRHQELRFGFSNEFLERGDGWPALKRAYGLPQRLVAGRNHAIAYRQLEEGEIDAMDVYTTDADIRYYGLRVLEDDRGFFPRYDAVFLYRAELETEAPEMVAMLRKLEARIDEEEMTAMNARVKLEQLPERRVAATFLRRELGVDSDVEHESLAARVQSRTWEHLHLVRVSLALAVAFGVPLGIAAAKRPVLGQVILGTVGVIQTIPALALLVILIGPFGRLGLRGAQIETSSAVAVAALFLYSLLPIVRNTFTGVRGIPLPVRESAAAMGLGGAATFRLVELPLAAPMILAGIKTAAVMNIGFATLGALIGAGGYGQPILTGIRLDDYALILEGAVPAALLALAAQGVMELAERFLVPRGLRIRPER